MIRTLPPFLLCLSILGGLAACNPDDPTGPKAFSIFDVYGIWKVQMEAPGCGPGELFYLDFGPFGVSPTADSVQISGTWYLDQKNPDTQLLHGYISRNSGIAFFTLDILDTETIEGIFVSSKVFSGAYRELDGCTNRLRGKFLE